MSSLGLFFKTSLSAIKNGGLQAKAMQSAFWTIFGYGSQQGIRLISNLILTRLLVPEMFGVMAIAQVFLIGLNMFSDLGINSSIVQNKRGEERDFLNTAWTIQVIRGICIYLALVLIAFPVSLLYGQPILFPVLCAIGLVAIIQGLQTTGFATSDKNLSIGTKTAIELSSQAIGIGVMILWASITPTIWALVGGSLVTAISAVILGHLRLSSYPHRLKIVREHLSEIIRFGKWIFLTSIIGFFANQIDKLILAKILTMAEMGFYTVAYTLSHLPAVVSSQLGNKVMMPVYAKKQDVGILELRTYVFKLRTRVVLLTLPVALIFMAFGDPIIRFLYDERYYSAGWMTEVLSLGVAIHSASGNGPFLLAMGKSREFSALVIARTVTLALSMFVGWYFYSTGGLIWGISLSALLYYFFQSYVYWRHGLWLWKLDILLFSIIGGVYGLSRLV